jgi:hypothetical protein
MITISKTMADASTSTSVSQHLAGHLGNLTPEQEMGLDAFKESLAKAGLYTSATDSKDASHDDPTLLWVAKFNENTCAYGCQMDADDFCEREASMSQLHRSSLRTQRTGERSTMYTTYTTVWAQR